MDFHPYLLLKWHCIYVQMYSNAILILAYVANPLGSAVFLCNYALLFGKVMPFSTCICFLC